MVKVHTQLVMKKGYLISGSEANRDMIHLQQGTTVSSESFLLSIICFFLFLPCSSNHTVVHMGPEEKVEEVDS